MYRHGRVAIVSIWPLSQMEVCDIVSKSVNLLLSRTVTGTFIIIIIASHPYSNFASVAGCLSRLVHDEGLTIPQLGQIWVNISHLADSVPHLEDFIRRATKSVTIAPSLPLH